MAIVVNDNLQNNSPKSLDNKYLASGTAPYASVAAANAAILSAYRTKGLTVLIDTGPVNAEYWYREGITDGDLVLKTSDPTTASNLGATGASLFSSKVGVDLQFRKIIAAGGLTVTQNTNDVTLTAPVAFNLIAGTNITTSGTYPNITINSSGEANNGLNLGVSGASVFTSKSGVNFQFRKIIGTGGTVVTQNTNDITISSPAQVNITGGGATTVTGTYPNIVVSTPSGSGTVTSVGVTSTDLTVTGSPITTAGTITVNIPNSGVTAGTYTNPTLTVTSKGIVTSVSNGTDLNNYPTSLVYSSGTLTLARNGLGNLTTSIPVGEINTASNLGVSGASVFATKSGLDFQFRKLIGSGGTTVTQNSNDVTISSPQQFSPIAGSGISITGTYPSLTITNTRGGINTVASSTFGTSTTHAQIATIDYTIETILIELVYTVATVAATQPQKYLAGKITRAFIQNGAGTYIDGTASSTTYISSGTPPTVSITRSGNSIRLTLTGSDSDSTFYIDGTYTVTSTNGAAI